MVREVLGYLACRFIFAVGGVFLIFCGYAAGHIESNHQLRELKKDLQAANTRHADERLMYRKAIIQLEDDNKSLYAKWAKAQSQVNRLEAQMEKPIAHDAAESVTKVISGKIANDLQKRELSFFGRLLGY